MIPFGYYDSKPLVPGKKPPKKKRKLPGYLKGLITGEILLIVLLLGVVLWFTKFPKSSEPEETAALSLTSEAVESSAENENGESEPKEDKEAADISFKPYSTVLTDPSNLIENTAIEIDGTVLDSVSDYSPGEEISFETGAAYTDANGIITFRGNNFRNNPTYGYAEMTENKLNGLWSKSTGSITYGSHTWSGSGWTGQPLMMKWPKETKAVMNMYDWAKEDDELVEVIYACMDGYIYFLNLKTGEATRDAMYVGWTFKGAGALDPRGYPLMYVGAGYPSQNGAARAFIINLVDCSILYTFGNADSFSLRSTVSFFDSSALVDAETDTLIYPGENGVLYLMKLNTQYNESTGSLTINPGSIVKWRYKGFRSGDSKYWYGMEDSAAVYKGYLFIADNGGHLMCLDLNTLKLMWVQDVLDDSNSTPVLSIEDGHLYLYVSTSFHLGWRSSSTATVPIWKFDAENGEMIWHTNYECYSEDSVSGGVQSTIAVGTHELSDYIYVTVSKTGGSYMGVLACIECSTGKVMWEHEAVYAWSSPVCVYNSDGSGNVIYCSCNGNMYLLDGLTGEVYDSFALSDGAIEASPAVYENYAVIGTRSCKIWGIELK